jgi:hypothetical protein
MKKYKIQSPKISHTCVPLKGLGDQINIFKAFKIKSVLSVFLYMHNSFLSFQPALLKRKLNIKFLLPSLTLADFPNNFKHHRRLSEHLLESQAAIGKPEQVS